MTLTAISGRGATRQDEIPLWMILVSPRSRSHPPSASLPRRPPVRCELDTHAELREALPCQQTIRESQLVPELYCSIELVAAHVQRRTRVPSISLSPRHVRRVAPGHHPAGLHEPDHSRSRAQCRSASRWRRSSRQRLCPGLRQAPGAVARRDLGDRKRPQYSSRSGA
jgi:hypothetical protein